MTVIYWTGNLSFELATTDDADTLISLAGRRNIIIQQDRYHACASGAQRLRELEGWVGAEYMLGRKATESLGWLAVGGSSQEVFKTSQRQKGE